ncbi:LAMI_0H02520g1_1 [Lachancea mirantina]|uniref:LAMI_0H02520g1_1 n=1 Tax=Lachancea mirantina TaxID=1230905 RepID=A0A1G4KE24_9SACH|nr:LAMI_0H02520g1_1 [Lachancea mirantina]
METLRKFFDSLWQYFLSLFYQRELKITIVGLQNSGKTSLARALLSKPFEQDTIPTLGMRMEQFYIGTNLIQLFDLAGQHRFHYMWNRYFDRSDLIIYVLDLSDMTNWNEAKHKLWDVLIKVNENATPVVLLGNKTDLVAPSEASAAAKRALKKSKSKGTAKEQPIMEDVYMAPLLRNYDYDDIPVFQLDETNLYLLRNIEILSKELGLDLKSNVLHTDTTQVSITSELVMFPISCKNGDNIQDILEWIAQM